MTDGGKLAEVEFDNAEKEPEEICEAWVQLVSELYSEKIDGRLERSFTR